MGCTSLLLIPLLHKRRLHLSIHLKALPLTQSFILRVPHDNLEPIFFFSLTKMLLIADLCLQVTHLIPQILILPQ